MTVKLLLLKSGEDVIADISEMTAGTEGDIDRPKRVVGYFLKKPCVVTLKNPHEMKEDTGPQKAGLEVSLFPWMALAKDEVIPMTADWLITMVDPIDKLKKMYLEDVLNYGRQDNKGTSTDKSSVSDK
tara:strand:+ start:68 stop:451 length:384 start_codon:yes stop_codon:yes gene_type:complete